MLIVVAGCWAWSQLEAWPTETVAPGRLTDKITLILIAPYSRRSFFVVVTGDYPMLSPALSAGVEVGE
jgi:hypothetical protein